MSTDSDDQGSERPLEEWSTSWLKLEVAQLLKSPKYVIMTHDEKLDHDYPVTDEEMRDFIRARRAQP
jgi:hypothetical protein